MGVRICAEGKGGDEKNNKLPISEMEKETERRRSKHSQYKEEVSR